MYMNKLKFDLPATIDFFFYPLPMAVFEKVSNFWTQYRQYNK